MLERVMGITPPPPVVEAACAKYRLIGGKSPNLEIAEAICAELRVALDADKAGECVQLIEAGMCFTEPLLEDSLQRLVSTGCERIIYLSMTAYESWAAWRGPYLRTVEAATKLGITDVVCAPVFGGHFSYLAAHVDTIYKTLAWLDATGDDHIIFVAHSLPLDDPTEMAATYEQQLDTAIAGISTELRERWNSELATGALSYVSVGARGGKWLSPTLEEVMQQAADAGAHSVIVCPLGFATDHMEVLYDLDISAAKGAKALGLQFMRTPTLASTGRIHPALIDAMVDSLQSALEEGSVL